jgi:hypothetical protein
MTPGLTMRPTGLGHGIYASVMASMPRSWHLCLGHGIYNDAVDFSGFSGGWAIGRIHERKGFGDAVGFFWSLHGVVLTAWDPHRRSRAHPCMAKARLKRSWVRWLEWSARVQME